MLSTSPLVAFAAITEPARAKDFYERVLGLRLVSDQPPALVFDANGTTLRLAMVETLTPAPYTVLGWIVADIRAELALLGARGVAFERFEGMSQDALGICTFPGDALVAWFKDPDGNLLSLTQFG